MKVKIVNNSPFPLPSYATELSAGMDLHAKLGENTRRLTIPPFSHLLIRTGVSIALPAGYEAQIRPRSGLALKRGLTVLNAPGTIDADYRGEIGVILYNASGEPQIIENGERIAQMVIAQYTRAEWEIVDTLDETERGEGGFGSTGV